MAPPHGTALRLEDALASTLQAPKFPPSSCSPSPLLGPLFGDSVMGGEEHPGARFQPTVNTPCGLSSPLGPGDAAAPAPRAAEGTP